MSDDPDVGYILIDPPVGPYSPADEIKFWIVDLKGMPQTPEVVEAIREAESWITRPGA